MMHILALVLAFSPTGADVVCIGDSITAGANLDRGRLAWPVLLEQRLAGDTQVHNLGVGGATLLNATDRPYFATKTWREAPPVEAQTVIVILGTNDSVLNERRRCWDASPNLADDLDSMLSAVRERYGSPRVLLCSPPPMFPDKPGLPPERAADLRERAPRLELLGGAYREFAVQRAGVDYLDLSRVLSESQVSDGVHLTPFGSAAIADLLAAVLRTPLDAAPESSEQRLAQLPLKLEHELYHGYERLAFQLPGAGGACSLVMPHIIAAGRPWIWRARFFGHQPALDLALLERGFHLVYCDVANLYGAPAAVERWEAAYELLHGRLGLSATPILHGLSRGGLAVLNFAIAHPERVGALVLDNAVCDYRSWPGGRNGKRSDADWQRLLVAYDLSAEQAFAGDGGPLGDLLPLAERGIAVHVLIGGADEVVPPQENGELLVAQLQELGGRVTAWRKPGAGHHPHGLYPVAPLARALLRELDVDAHNPAAGALPSVEYRGAPAGWGAGGSWAQQVAAMRATAAAHPELELVFLGDSITQGLTGSAERLTSAEGRRAIDRFERAISLGLSGDRTEHLLYRIEHGALALLEPRLVVLQIGVNNINSGHQRGDEVAAGLRAVVQSLLEHEPQARVLICGPFPTAHSPDDPKRAAIDAVHRMAESLRDEQRVSYLDLRPLFLDEAGRPNQLMRSDAVHINGAGQAAWMEAIAPQVRASLQR